MTAGTEILLSEALIVAGFTLIAAIAWHNRARLPAAVMSAAWVMAFHHGYISEAEFWTVLALAATALGAMKLRKGKTGSK